MSEKATEVFRINAQLAILESVVKLLINLMNSLHKEKAKVLSDEY